MDKIKLNLARAWRSKSFDEVIGQDLLIRMLRNGLYLQHYFPVYLFSGQRGCGKTTTARIFGAALNCDQLSSFQKDPQGNSVPCLQCTSCVAMEHGRHPDFIEIDGASHTGVDDVRSLIDSALLMPLMGRKKIYLVDEAHMLSKAAFNALLKILEEPPASVVFILATTDPQKIIETVRSRCLQLFFKSIEPEVLQERLRIVCEREDIKYDRGGLAIIAQQADGSVRDALNVLEQVRFSSDVVTQEAVLCVLGYMSDRELLGLYEHVLSGSVAGLLNYIAQIQWKKFSASAVWEQFLGLVRVSLWLRHGVKPDELIDYHDEIRKICSTRSVQELIAFLQILHDQELLFARTTSKHDFFEMVLLQLCQRMNKTNPGGAPSSPVAPVPDPVLERECDEDDADETQIDDEEDEEQQDDEPVTKKWGTFIGAIDGLKNPLLSSIFSQGTVKEWNEQTYQLEVEFSKEFVFFTDLLEKSTAVWLPVLKSVFGDSVLFVPKFTGTSVSKKVHDTGSISSNNASVQKSDPLPAASRFVKNTANFKTTFSRQKVASKSYVLPGSPIDISDKQAWPLAHMIMRYIPGTIREIRE